MNDTILELFKLSKTFGRLVAVDRISMHIKKGQVYGLLGPNGSGKSTTLGMVLQVVNPTSGSFQWFGGSLNNQEAIKKVGALIERPNFYPYLSAYDNLRLVCKIKNCPESAIEEQLQLVGLWDRREHKFKTFSLGMKQRLAIASALLNRPELLILDEPTNGLDPEGIHQIRSLIAAIAEQGTTIVLASHLLDEVEKVCSHVIVLKNGVKYFEGEVAELTNTHGYFKLATADNSALISALKKMKLFSNITSQNGFVLAYPERPVAPETLNEKLATQQLFLSTLDYKNPSLEEQFLSLTQNTPQP